MERGSAAGLRSETNITTKVEDVTYRVFYRFLTAPYL
jgi:hypothetical protein